MNIIKGILYSNVWIAGAGLSLAWFLQNAIGKELPPIGALFIFVCLFAAYTLLRIWQSKTFEVSPKDEKSQFIRKHKDALQQSAIIAIGIALLCLFFMPCRLFLAAIPPAMLTLLYFSPQIGKYQFVQLKNKAYLKAVLVALNWAYFLLIFPLILTDESRIFELYTLVYFLVIALYIWTLTLIFDIRDAKQDKEREIKTWYSLVGLIKMKKICYFAFILTLFLICFLYFSEYISLPAALSFSMGIGCSALALHYTHEDRSDFWYDALIDGSIFIPPILLAISRIN